MRIKDLKKEVKANIPDLSDKISAMTDWQSIALNSAETNKKINQAVKDSCRIRSQLLHAYRMEFPDGRIVTAPEPASFARVQTKLAKEKR